MTPGGTYLLNIGAVQEMRDVFADCSETGTASRPGHFRLPRVYAPYVRGALMQGVGALNSTQHLSVFRVSTFTRLLTAHAPPPRDVVA